ncbi:hypothetical protein UlMin_038276 [Ulmus minor]
MNILDYFGRKKMTFLSTFGKPFIQGIVDGSCLTDSYSGFEMLHPSFDEVNQHCSLDILPILFDEAPFSEKIKYPLDSSHAQDVYSISVLPQEGNHLQCASQVTFLRFLEVPDPANDQTCDDAQLNCHNCIDLQMNTADAYSSCVLDINVEKESLLANESTEEPAESLKSETVPIHSQKVLRRQASLGVGGKLIELLMDYGTSKDKTGAERVHEAPNNPLRRCRRTASFDSRKIVLLFSILSSLGTLVLIILTLKVRQSLDGIHV